MVEEEQPHEIYAGLLNGLPAKLPASYLGVSSQPQTAEGKRTDRRSRRTVGEPGGVLSRDRPSRVVDPADEARQRPSSQFMEFYRRSCQGRDADGSSTTRVSEPVRAPKSRAKQSRPARKAQNAVSSKETKSQKRRRARLEREREVRKEKRIRSMLNSDFTEEDETLYRSLHR